MLKSVSLFILTWVFAVGIAHAETFRRSVEFEWDAIEGAKSYDLEIQKGEKIDKFVTSEPIWKGQLAPGVYTMKVRAKDRRGVPGDWSPAEELRINLETAKILSPKLDEKIESSQSEEEKMTFKWEPVRGAEVYEFELTSEDGAIQRQEKLTEPEHTLTLPVAKNYTWKVKAFGLGMESDSIAEQKFSLWGQKLKTPKIERPENRFVREVKWTPAEYASDYIYTLDYLNPKTKKWERVDERTDHKESRINFDPNWAGGRYRLQVQAQSSLRTPSGKSRIDFIVKNGDRSPAAEETATVRMSIERLTGWYAVASYLITMTDYKGTNFDKTNTSLAYSAIGGTGRLGAGYFSKTNPWGFLGILDLSGISVEGSGTYTFASSEANAIYRSNLGSRGELRQQFGVFYKELPETLGKSSGAITENNLLKTAGPHYGVEYWLALSSKLGFQMNAHLYPSLFAVQTPTGEAIRPTLSAQVGLLGSYRLDRNLTGLIGYAYRQDHTEYQARSGFGSAGSGDFNSVMITGHYLNLFLEWAL